MTERRYRDSDCFPGGLRNEADKCAAVLALADRGDVRIVTSALTLAEVLMLRGREALLLNRRPDVTALFDRECIVTMAVTRRSGTRTGMEHGIRPKDAVHVASALAAGVETLNTFDNGLISKSGAIGKPPLTIEHPEVLQPELALDHGQQDQGPA